MFNISQLKKGRQREEIKKKRAGAGDARPLEEAYPLSLPPN